jgi:hypothetical protein
MMSSINRILKIETMKKRSKYTVLTLMRIADRLVGIGGIFCFFIKVSKIEIFLWNVRQKT